MNENVKANKMGTEPVPKVMLTMGMPMIVSMVLQACYNIVDSMFVARIPDADGIVHMGEYAVNALTLAFPVQMLIIALGIGTGVGVNAALARCLGQKDSERVARLAGNGVVLGIIIYVCFFLFGLFGIDWYLQSQTKDPVVLSMGTTYMKICTLLSFGIVLFSIYEKLLQATGKTMYSTIAQVAGALTNVILDPIMIFGYFGCPAMGIAGAAYATVIGQVVSMVVAMFFHYRKNKEVPNGLKYLKLQGRVVKEIYTIGFPAIIMQAVMSVMTYGINIIFGAVSASAVTAYGIFYKIQQFIFFAAFGLRDAITPIVSYNYGTGDKKRVKDGIKYGILYVEIIMVIGILILELGAGPLAAAFGLSAETAELCVLAMRIIALGFLFVGGNIAIQGVFQALDCGIGSLAISLIRQLVVVLPLAWFFTTLANADFMIWFAFPIAEAAAFVVAFVLLKREKKRIGL